MGNELEVWTPVIPVAAVVLLVVILVIVSLYDRYRQRAIVAEKALNLLPKCPVCGGQMERAEILSSNMLFFVKAKNKRHVVGAVRCSQCGNVALFS